MCAQIARVPPMCNSCGKDTRVAGLRELNGLCIRCMHRDLMQLRQGVQPLMAAVQDLMAIYGNRLYAAPASIQRIFDAAEACKGGTEGEW